MLSLMLQGSESDEEERGTQLQVDESGAGGEQAPPTFGRVPAWHDEDDEKIRYNIIIIMTH